MNRSTRLVATVGATALLAACNNPFSKKAELETETQKFSYSIGVDIGKSLENISEDIDVNTIVAGLNDVLEKKELALDDEARRQVQMTVAQKLREKHIKKMEEKAKSAVEDGKKFLEENAKKSGVKTTASGLQYEVLKEGTGAKPKATDVVTVNYKGTLTNGETFDSSYDRGQPATFQLNQVIPGWTEGVQLMTVGSKYKFVLPSAIAYGEQGAGGKIGPNETLVFEVELLDINKQ
ncbi:FKBP-type peptidyl-prolyl cis-trans isomerase [Amnimonas aquatica]|uniref:Peptidyl-prolyl cis-trans isomerase n=1 Tax=Amnimonas aquatica TaxID=2094561 RepID=A0A2P6AST6_9GAMM|nr:FKBP-type peptidyl-prolyl cis-trans isomerase [Amnimonas aquatica]PQA43721.1 hypothetical protein C5O18_05125 [Amnimonas aquatica]